METTTKHDNSSTIVQSNYNDDSRLLTIQFKHEDAAYTYAGISPEVYKDFLGAKSQGKFLHLYIKPYYQSVRIA